MRHIPIPGLLLKLLLEAVYWVDYNLQVLFKDGPWLCLAGHIVWGPSAGTGLQAQEGGMRDQSVQLRMRKRR